MNRKSFIEYNTLNSSTQVGHIKYVFTSVKGKSFQFVLSIIKHKRFIVISWSRSLFIFIIFRVLLLSEVKYEFCIMKRTHWKSYVSLFFPLGIVLETKNSVMKSCVKRNRNQSDRKVSKTYLLAIETVLEW